MAVLKFRYGTKKAKNELALELNLPKEDWMQDWPYEVVVYSDIEKYINHYQVQNDEDKKFVLMEGIIQSIEEQPTEELFRKYCNKIKSILEKDFDIHEFTINYWACFENKNIIDAWKIAPFMRKLWKEKHIK